jgi:hypothetical protein
MKVVYYIFPILLGFALISCEETNNEPSNSIDNNNSQEIYLKVYQDLNFPSGSGSNNWCDIISGCYSDNHPDTPDNFILGQVYGPLAPGNFTATFCFDVNSPSVSIHTYNFSLEEPPSGFRRTYSKLIRDYNEPLNRCVVVSGEDWTYSYIDTPL